MGYLQVLQLSAVTLSFYIKMEMFNLVPFILKGQKLPPTSHCGEGFGENCFALYLLLLQSS
jgi:hypothetical protein